MQGQKQGWSGGLCGLLLLVAWPVLSEAQGACRSVRSNFQGAARADITVSSTAITVAPVHTSRCGLLILNTSTADMRCADVSKDPVPTAVTGLYVKAGTGVAFEFEAQGQWQCIRATGADASASIAEAVP